MPIDKNIAPIYDDFSELKNYHQLLFRPGYSLQSRELTQIQTVLQNQLERFGKHIFKNGSMVAGGQTTLNANSSYLKIKNTVDGESASAGVSLSGFINKKINIYDPTGVTVVGSGVVVVIDDTTNDYRLILNEISGTFSEFAGNNIIKIDGEVTQSAEVKSSSFYGKATTCSIDDGIYFVDSYFVKVYTQSILVDYSQSASTKIGLETSYEFIDENEDSSLLDNSAGFDNYAEPGAMRLKITLTLTLRDLETAENLENFIELLRLEDGVLLKQVVYPIYSELEKTFARRTYDESGDYTVRPYLVEPQDKFKGTGTLAISNGTVTGTGTLFTEELEKNSIITAAGTEFTVLINPISNTSIVVSPNNVAVPSGTKYTVKNGKKLNIKISPGKSYVKGYEFETIAPTNIIIDKARQVLDVENHDFPIIYGGYLTAKATDFATELNFSELESVFLYNTLAEPIGTATVNMVTRVGSDINVYITDAVIWNAESDFSLVKYLGKRTELSFNSETDVTSGSDTITISNNGIADGEIVFYTSEGKTPVTGLTDKTFYFAKTTATNTLKLATTLGGSAINITADAEFTGTSHKIFKANTLEFDGSSGSVVVSSTDTIAYTAHGLVTGQMVVYSAGEGSDVDGLISGHAYYVIRTNANAFQLAVTYENALSGIEIEISVGSGTQHFFITNVVGLKTSSFFTFEASGNITVSGGSTTGTLIGVGTQFLTELLVGSIISFNNVEYIVQSISSDTSATIKLFLNTGGDVPTISTSTVFFIKDAYIIGSSKPRLLFPIGYDNISNRNSANNADTFINTDYYVRKRITSSTITTSAVTFTVNDPYEFFTVVDSNNFQLFRNNQLLNNDDYTFTITNTNRTITITPDSGSFDISDTYKLYAKLNVENGPYRTKTFKEYDLTGYGSGTEQNLVLGRRYMSSFNWSANNWTLTLQKADVEYVERVILNPVVSGGEVTGGTDITSLFDFDNGQRDAFYDHGAIRFKPTYRGVSSSYNGNILVLFNYWEHSSSAGAIVSKSYSDYTIIPVYQSERSGEILPLRDYIDFRPIKSDGPAAQFSTSELPEPSSSFQTDVSFYIGRKDRIAITGQSKAFKVLTGIPTANPLFPPVTEDLMVIYNLSLNPYTYNERDLGLQFVENKRYTMRMIGKLEKRLENLEYYTSLSLTEKRAADLLIRDTSGNERFKNGFLVDNFSGHNIGDVTLEDYNCSIDYEKGELRPRFVPRNFKLHAAKSTNFATVTSNKALVKGDLMMIPYISEKFISQTQCSGFVNVNPYSVFNWTGQLKLVPQSDFWTETKVRPAVSNNIDGLNDNYITELQEMYEGTQWNDWETHLTGLEVISETSEIDFSKQKVLGTTTRPFADENGNIVGFRNINTIQNEIVTTRLSQQRGERTRTGFETKVVPTSITNNLGSRVVDVSVVPYIREKTIIVKATSMKPNKKLYAFFDSTDVTAYINNASKLTCATMEDWSIGERIIQTGSGAAATVAWYDGYFVYVIEIAGNFVTGQNITGTVSDAVSSVTAIDHDAFTSGDDLVTNDVGEFVGMFVIPDPITTELKFTTGEKNFKLIDNDENSNKNSETFAEAIYTANGVVSSTEDMISTIRSFEIQRKEVSESEVINNRIIREERREIVDTFDNSWVDPLAESFLIDGKLYPEGVMLSKVKLFFRRKDSSIPVTIQIRPTQNGYPHSTYIMPFASKTLKPADVTVPTEAAIRDNDLLLTGNSGSDFGTNFEFDSPVYLQPGEYCIVVLSNSNNYETYIGEIGQKRLGSDRLISEQPYAGSFFKSQNSSTWTAEQTMDMMFELYLCEFVTGTNYYGEFVDYQSGVTKPYSDITYVDVMKMNGTFQTFNSTTLTTEFMSKQRGIAYSNSPSRFSLVKNADNYTFNTEQEILPGSVESFRARTTLKTSNKNVSPIIDLDRMNIICIENLINNATDILSISKNVTFSSIPVFVDGGTLTTGLNVPVSVVSSDITTSLKTGSSELTISSGGTYSTNGTYNLVFTGGGGSGATGTATISGGTITAVTITAGGSGYTSAPTITVNYTGSGTPTAGTIVFSSTGPVHAHGEVYVKKVASLSKLTGATVLSSNLVTCDITHISSENEPKSGGALARYITRVVSLDNDSDWIKVFLTANKPSGTDIKVYYKVLSPNTSGTFTNQDYVEMQQVLPNTSDFSIKDSDWKEFAFVPQNETTIGSFNKMAIKIVLLSSNKCVVPRVTDLINIALDIL